jgi:hypothetical protein
MRRMILPLVILGIVIMTACADIELTLEAEPATTDPTPITQSEEISTDNTITEPIVEVNTDQDDEVSDTQNNLAYQLLEEAMTNTQAMHGLNFYTSTEDIMNYSSYEDSNTIMEHFFKNTYEGTMNRNPTEAYIHETHTYTSLQINEDASTDILEEYSKYFTTHASKDSNIYTYFSEDDKWYKKVPTSEFRTIEHLEELIDFFMSDPNKLSISDQETQFDHHKSIDLTLSKEEFVNHIELLSHTFFNGVYDDDSMYEYASDLLPEDIDYYYTSLVLDDSNNVINLFVSYGSISDDDTDSGESSFFMLTTFTDHNEVDPVIIPEEVINNATVMETWRG